MLEVIVSSFESAGFPHLENLKRSNPGIPIHTYSGKEATEPSKKLDYWRNADRVIRNWWKANKGSVAADYIAFIEGDVLVNYDLTKLIVPGVDLTGSVIREQGDGEPWKWWIDGVFLPEEVKGSMVGVIPLAFLLFSRKCLDFLTSPQWDEAFREDIFCELRTPSIAKAGGFVIKSHAALAHCLWHPITVEKNKPGIWHSVKN